MVWLRIDYNGRGGFDAFVTDINLARIRVSYVMPEFPETEFMGASGFGLGRNARHPVLRERRFGRAAEPSAVLYAGLDQFGPNSRTIGPMQVQSDYNFTRGGDIDEIRIYDRMLSDQNVGLSPKETRPRRFHRSRAIWPSVSGETSGGCAMAGIAKGDAPPLSE